MAVYINKKGELEVHPHKKNTRQGRSKNTKLSASSRNGCKKRYRGQGNK